MAVCRAAYDHVSDYATYWVSRAPGARRLQELPERHDFITVCRSMPENVQRCMHSMYVNAHDQACDAVLSRLDPWDRRKVDALFLEAQSSSR